MNKLRLTILSTLIALAAVSFADARDCHSRRDDCRSRRDDPCRLRAIGTPERGLKNIRGTAGITQVNETTTTVTPIRGVNNFTVRNVSFVTTPLAPILSTIFNTQVNAAAGVSVSFDVVFNCPFRNTPTVVLSLENSDNATTTRAIANSFGVFASNVSPTGFTANVDFIIYGQTLPDVFQLILELLGQTSGSAVDFIAQGN